MKIQSNGTVNIRYIGSRDVWHDNLYHTGLYFTHGQVRAVPFATAKQLLRHSDVFALSDGADEAQAQQKAEDDAADDTDSLLDEAQAQQKAEDENLDEVFDVYQSISLMDKDSLKNFIETNFEQKADMRKSVDTLRDEAKLLVDRFGVA